MSVARTSPDTRRFDEAAHLDFLPEFGFSCRLGDLYRGTPIFSERQRSS